MTSRQFFCPLRIEVTYPYHTDGWQTAQNSEVLVGDVTATY
jgi:hypothetical protein